MENEVTLPQKTYSPLIEEYLSRKRKVIPRYLGNEREKETAREHIKEGWKCLNKGFPDFLFYKELLDGKVEGFFVEVKKTPFPNKNPKRGYDINLTPAQKEYHRVLKGMGFEVKVIYKD